MVVGWVSALGLMVGYFRANHAAGVSWLTRFAGKFSKPGSTTLRYTRTESAVCGRFQSYRKNHPTITLLPPAGNGTLPFILRQKNRNTINGMSPNVPI